MDRLFRRGLDTGARVDFLAGFEVLREDTDGVSDEAAVLAAALVVEAATVERKRGSLNIYPAYWGQFS